MKARIYHNPRCSKSRATLALLEERGVETEVIEYLNDPPSAEEIRALLSMLQIDAASLLRKGESAYRESGLGPEASENELIELMVREPIVIERPIVVAGSKARIGRPPEGVLGLFS